MIYDYDIKIDEIYINKYENNIITTMNSDEFHIEPASLTNLIDFHDQKFFLFDKNENNTFNYKGKVPVFDIYLKKPTYIKSIEIVNKNLTQDLSITTFGITNNSFHNDGTFYVSNTIISHINLLNNITRHIIEYDITTGNIINYNSLQPNPDDYELYGNYIWPPRQVQHIAFVPSINQYVFMAITVDPNSTQPYYLKMVSQDNNQARYIETGPLDIASKLFDPLRWNNGYPKFVNGKIIWITGYKVIDGHYKVRTKC